MNVKGAVFKKKLVLRKTAAQKNNWSINKAAVNSL